ncbi:hypothetical protein KUTeg_015852 [Tegillarca granosa]|uniref:Uncharacterized protein n=1 Tax=Tegillarca granosa TaxID=220873 RepID=A0ABQ9ENX4_TEGGR|nr:hypothetical protein KUTeg_015852 [Tegillarca granosa]
MFGDLQLQMPGRGRKRNRERDSVGTPKQSKRHKSRIIIKLPHLDLLNIEEYSEQYRVAVFLTSYLTEVFTTTDFPYFTRILNAKYGLRI